MSDDALTVLTSSYNPISFTTEGMKKNGEVVINVRPPSSLAGLLGVFRAACVQAASAAIAWLPTLRPSATPCRSRSGTSRCSGS